MTPTTLATTPPVVGNTADQPFDRSLDLLVVTFDFANTDDGHAAAATLDLATSIGVQPLVVAGTPAPGAPGFIHPYSQLMSAIWGNSWVDGANRSAAISTAADRWLSAIDRGGVVRVAEGGVSDFTADVVREVQRRRPGLDTGPIVEVVHHITRNIDMTRVGDIDFLRAETTYVRIDSGNDLNGTADLFAPSPALEAAALAGPHGAAWSAAFDFRPATDLDFSDTVTALHIVGVGLDVVAHPDDFATAFMT